MIMKEYMLIRKKTGEQSEYVLPIENISFSHALDNSYSISKPYEAEQLADYAVEKIVSFYKKHVLEDSDWNEFDKKMIFGDKVVGVLQRFSLIRKNLTANEVCLVHNNPVLLEIQVALLDVREEYHERVNKHNKENEADDFSDGYFGEKVENILVKRRYIQTKSESKL